MNLSQKRPFRTARRTTKASSVYSQSNKAAVVLVALSFVLFAIGVSVGYPLIGQAAGLIAVAPILVATHFYGPRLGMTTAVVAIATNTVVLAAYGVPNLFAPRRFVMLAVILAFSAVAGVMHTLGRRGRRTEDLLNIAFEAAQDGLWDYRIPSNQVYFSPRWFTMLGYDPNEFAHHFDNWVRLLHPDDRGPTLEVIEQVTKEGKPKFSVSFRMKQKNGDWRWILSRGKAVERDTSGATTRLVGVHSDISNLKKAEADLVYLAYHDQLTGLLNRKAFFEQAELSLVQAPRVSDKPVVAFLIVDLDNFKDVNDSYGHDFGDQVLSLAAARLQDHIRDSDFLFRLGGDEFVIVLTTIKRGIDAAVVARKLIDAFACSFAVEDRVVYSTLSVGISLYPQDGDDVPTLMRRADTALYDAKRDRNTYRFYTMTMQQEAVSRMQLIADLRTALDSGQLALHYQPIVSADGEIAGAEALLRWILPDGTIRMPGEFIEIAEDTGVILDIGKWVLKEATATAQSWRVSGLGDLRISVNVSPRQLRAPSTIEDIETALERSGLPPRLLTVELTESSFVDLSEEIAERLDAIRLLGVELAIDDFGTGYSSMSYLKRLPVDVIKIDRSFVIGLPASPPDVSIVRAVVTMAHGLGVAIVAEGVDAREQVDFLADLQCEAYQGFYYSMAVASDQFAALVRSPRAWSQQQ